MKTLLKLSIFSIGFIALLSCKEEVNRKVETPDLKERVSAESEEETSPSQSSEPIVESPAPSQNYHITLNKGGEILASVQGEGNVRISDVFLCSVEDWKMKIITDEYNPQKMIGNEYPVHVMSDEYNATDCKCRILDVQGTGITNTIGERVIAKGGMVCNDGEVTGSFAVQLIQQNE